MSPNLLPPSSSPVEQPAAVTVPQLWRGVLRQGWVIAGIALGIGVLAAGLSLLQDPEYEAETTLRITALDGGQSAASDIARDLGLPVSRGPSQMDTELLLLESRQIAEGVVDLLALQLVLRSPQTPRSEVIERIDLPREVIPGVYEFRANQSEAFELTAAGGPAAERRSIRPGEEFDLAGGRIAFQPHLDPTEHERIVIEVLPFRQAVRSMMQRTEVNRLRGQIVAVRHRSPDRELAATVPNAVAESFLDYHRRSRGEESAGAIDFLRDQVDSYGVALAQAEDRVQRFRETERVVRLDSEATAHVQRLAELEARREELIAERNALRRLLEHVEEGQDGGEPASRNFRQLAAYPEFFRNPSIQDILSSMVQLENRRAELRTRRTPEHVDIQGIDYRIRELEVQLHRTARDYLANVTNQLAGVEETLTRFSGQLDAVPEREVEFARLTREHRLLEEIYTLLQTRLKEAEIRQAEDPRTAHVVDAALVPFNPVSPQPLRSGLLALFAGLLLGLAVAFVREVRDGRVYDEEALAGVPGIVRPLGSIPLLGLPTERRLMPARRSEPRLHETARGLVFREDPTGPEAEAFHQLWTRIEFATGAPHHAFVVTSALHGEGKSTVAANLAEACAATGKRTLLIDGDLRRGELASRFGVSRSPGLADVLAGTIRWEEAVQRADDRVNGGALSLLTSGIPSRHPAEVLDTASATELFGELQGSFDRVIIDAPPLIPVADSYLLGRQVGSVLLVARPGVTERQKLERVAHELGRISVPIIGVVINASPGPFDVYRYERASLPA